MFNMILSGDAAADWSESTDKTFTWTSRVNCGAALLPIGLLIRDERVLVLSIRSI